MLSGAALLAAAAGACAAAAIAELARPRANAQRRREATRPPRGTRAAGLAAVLVRVRRHGDRAAATGQLEQRIAAAGAPLGLEAADVMAIKGAAAIAGGVCAIPLLAALPGRLGVVMLLAAPAAGFLAPDVALARRARRRAERVGRELADVIDLMRVAVHAGLPIGRALTEVGRRCSGVLADELRAATARIELGVGRGEALAALWARCPLPAVGALVTAIGRADRHGAPLAPALEGLAVEARAEQARRVRDDAARAAPKIQLVVALVLVPAVMLLVGAVLVEALAPLG